jgi:nucleotide-binding universal stress UspA family protein
MKKVIIPFDGVHFSQGAIDFAIALNQFEPILLSGVFLQQLDYANLWAYSGGMVGPTFVPFMDDADVELIEKNIERFTCVCEKNDIEYRVHKNMYEAPIPELRYESRFADLLVVGSEAFYENMGITNPNPFLKDTLRQAECPVVVVPESFTFPESVVLSYDGSESSVYAIKQFAYLFPQLSNKSTLLVTPSESGTEQEFPDESNIEELAARHFKDLTLMRVQLEPRKYFSTWLMYRKSTVLVSGSFGRSAFSEFFTKSFITDVINTHRIPVFLAHR